MRLYSTANERGFALNRFFGCLSATCRRDARDPLVSHAFQNRTRLYSTASDGGFVIVHGNFFSKLCIGDLQLFSTLLFFGSELIYICPDGAKYN
ncbi:MAG: hypothetical protein LBP59_18515 [Planctomycetaceae bacterium]|nr:hypothetical protein [Planctomycetaceae bacterium]